MHNNKNDEVIMYSLMIYEMRSFAKLKREK